MDPASPATLAMQDNEQQLRATQVTSHCSCYTGAYRCHLQTEVAALERTFMDARRAYEAAQERCPKLSSVGLCGWISELWVADTKSRRKP